MTPTIRIHDLGKKYRLGTTHARSLNELAARWTGRLRGRRMPPEVAPGPKGTDDESRDFWALRDVSFEVAPGEVVGIIGRNGAGKSTLLKILSRVTRPTAGFAEIRGRVGSLLEVGTGFHPEMTGRENVYMNGTLLGMTKAEVRRRFDEIVEFAGVERFVDTPVKRYSSGMKVRLGFAVAAHLEPEILIIDEVLAVGDAVFQRKCFDRMRTVATSGKSILYVSHHLSTVQSICRRAILLRDGTVAFAGTPTDVINRYVATRFADSSTSIADRTDRVGGVATKMTSIEVVDAAGDAVIKSASGLRITMTYEGKSDLIRPQLMVGVYDRLDGSVLGLDTASAADFPSRLPSRGSIRCKTGPIALVAGDYVMNVALFSDGQMVDYVQGAACITVHPDDRYFSGRAPDPSWTRRLIGQEWEHG